MEPLNEGGNEVAGHEIRVRRQQHSDTSVSWRVDDAFVQATDTLADPGVVEFAAGVGLLLHEAWYAADEPRMDAVPEELRPGFAAHSDARPSRASPRRPASAASSSSTSTRCRRAVVPADGRGAGGVRRAPTS